MEGVVESQIDFGSRRTSQIGKGPDQGRVDEAGSRS